MNPLSLPMRTGVDLICLFISLELVAEDTACTNRSKFAVDFFFPSPNPAKLPLSLSCRVLS